MAGGIGSRFWPMSTQKFPKQFQDILGTGRTMIQQTFDRIKQIVPTENIYVITNQEYVELSHHQLPEIPLENIVGEPVMKNTAACNIYMVNKIADRDPDANVIVLPADHLIIKSKISFSSSNDEYNLTLELYQPSPTILPTNSHCANVLGACPNTSELDKNTLSPSIISSVGTVLDSPSL